MKAVGNKRLVNIQRQERGGSGYNYNAKKKGEDCRYSKLKDRVAKFGVILFHGCINVR